VKLILENWKKYLSEVVDSSSPSCRLREWTLDPADEYGQAKGHILAYLEGDYNYNSVPDYFIEDIANLCSLRIVWRDYKDYKRGEVSDGSGIIGEPDSQDLQIAMVALDKAMEDKNMIDNEHEFYNKVFRRMMRILNLKSK
jgi:hypothetical protein